ncbi:hypothetical protein ABPG72_012939 [Tetrahymena utriculariae]
MGCVQLKQHKSNKYQQESLQCSNKNMVMVKNQKNNKDCATDADPQIIRSLSNISDDKKNEKICYQVRSSNSSKQTGVGENSKQDQYSKSHVSFKAAPKYPVTLEYVLARKSFVENQNIPQEHRLNMFPAPKLKGIEKSSLYYRRKSTAAEIMRHKKVDQRVVRAGAQSYKF